MTQVFAKPAPVAAAAETSPAPPANAAQTHRPSVPPTPPTPQKPRTPGTSAETECSVIPAWKLFAAGYTAWLAYLAEIWDSVEELMVEGQ
ncbi:hypothetical protein AXG93_620s1310 [Marchantia polymorpha subsp. ruderalis]|uniref:Uncharacterized protein n=1 Tax=Marchantia polymorpha subsp. ruderalis TaxID=1480154 RepID=A0A176VQS7_MARPO|nr:hypothetical protein AXG93_620s1310 [Marchantia polymorpha subsp. ruderalis]